MFKIDEKFPEFELPSYDPRTDEVGSISNADVRRSWLVLFFYPADFTFVCPTELKDLNKRIDEFQKLEVEIVAVSTDTVYTHKGWVDTEPLLKGLKYRMAADHNGRFSRELGIYDEASGMAQRAAFIIDPDGVLRAADIVSDNIGRGAGELLRKLKALTFVRNNPGKACPASWDTGAQTLQPSIQIAGKVASQLT